MSDDELRALERRFRETGAVSDEAAWIAGRVHAGELTAAQVEIAAISGHEGAFASVVRVRWRTTEECAGIFSVAPPTIRRWVRQGCPAARDSAGARFDVAAVLRWLDRRPSPPARRHVALVRALAQVDSDAAAAFRPFTGESRDKLRGCLASWALGSAGEYGWRALFPPLEKDPRKVVTEWLVRQLESPPGGADGEAKVATVASCLLSRDADVPLPRLEAIPPPRHEAIERLIRLLAKKCECVSGFKKQSARELDRLHTQKKLECLSSEEEPYLHSGDWEYTVTKVYRCVTCECRWRAWRDAYDESVSFA